MHGTESLGWPHHFDGVQFARDPETLTQYFRAMTPNTGPFDVNVVSDAVSARFARIGPGILVTHSQSGGPGWLAAIKSPNIKAIVAFEPGSNFLFPQGEGPAQMPSAFDTLQGVPAPVPEFMALTRISIVIVYGDNIPSAPVDLPREDSWRVRLAMARLWVDALSALREKPAGTVRITAGEHPAISRLQPTLKRFLPEYPDINVEIIVDYGLTDIVAEGYDAGIRLGEQIAKDVIALRLGRARRRLPSRRHGASPCFGGPAGAGAGGLVPVFSRLSPLLSEPAALVPGLGAARGYSPISRQMTRPDLRA